MKKIFTVFILLCSVILHAQDPHFSMPYSSSMYMNPGFAGTSGVSRVQGHYRNQWPNISGTYVTSFLSYDQYVKAVRGGAGISYLRDVSGQGAFKLDRVDFTYSYASGGYQLHEVNRLGLCFGFNAGYVQRKVDWSKLTFGTPSAGPGMKEIVSYPDFSSGVLFYTSRLYAGLAVWHMTGPEQGFIPGSTLPMKYVAHCGVNIGNPDSLKGLSMTPSILYLQQQNFRSFIMQCAVSYSNCVVGLGYRNGDAIIGSVGFRTNLLRISYSYDLTISQLGVVTGGSHEVSLSLTFNRKSKPEWFRGFSIVAF